MAGPERAGPERAGPERAGTAPGRALAALLVLGACQLSPYQPLVFQPVGGLPADAFARCRELLAVRYQRLCLVDPDGFRLQTDWIDGDESDVTSQVRATVFRERGG